MNVNLVLHSIKSFLEDLSKSSFIYCPETFEECPYPVFCINKSLDIRYRNELSLRYGKGDNLKNLFEDIAFENPPENPGISFGRIYKQSGVPKEWFVSYSGDQWILIVIVPGKMDIDRFKVWKEFMVQPLHGTSPLLQKVQEVKLNLCRVQQRIEIFKRATDLQLQYQQYLMEDRHVI